MTAAAETLRAAAARLHEADDTCQHPNCGCPEELHQPDADGLTWCKDCYDQHPYQAVPAADVPEHLRGPLAAWLEDAAKGCDAAVVAAAQVWPDSPAEQARWITEQQPVHALTVGRLVLGEEAHDA